MCRGGFLNWRASKVCLGEAGSGDFHRCSSTALLVDLQRRMMSIIGMQRKAEETLSLSLQCEISVQWAAVVGKRPVGPSLRPILITVPLVFAQGCCSAN